MMFPGAVALSAMSMSGLIMLLMRRFRSQNGLAGLDHRILSMHLLAVICFASFLLIGIAVVGILVNLLSLQPCWRSLDFFLANNDRLL